MSNKAGWLRTEHYAKLSKKENPHGLSCTLCEKTHTTKQCPNKVAQPAHKEEEKPSYSSLYDSSPYNWD